MEYDKEEAQRRREYEKALAAQNKLAEKLAELNRKTRSAKNRLLATTKSEKWHRFSLAWLDREAGYTGEMASARVWLRNQPADVYIQLLLPFAQARPDATNIAIEVAAVRASLDDWTDKGNALLLEHAKRDYAEEVASFRAWQREHPDDEGWRSKKATRAQWMLMGRTADALGIDPPARVNRGEAHDWLEQHGGNRRLGSGPDAAPSNSGSQHRGGRAVEYAMAGTNTGEVR